MLELFGFSKLKGRVKIELRDKVTKEVTDVRFVENLIVNAGLQRIGDLMIDVSNTGFTHMAVGTSNATPAASDTALGNEVDRNAVTSRSRSSQTLTFVGDWGSGEANGSTLREAGIFDQSSGGTMLCRTTYTDLVKDDTQELKVTWTIVLSDA